MFYIMQRVQSFNTSYNIQSVQAFNFEHCVKHTHFSYIIQHLKRISFQRLTLCKSYKLSTHCTTCKLKKFSTFYIVQTEPSFNTTAKCTKCQRFTLRKVNKLSTRIQPEKKYKLQTSYTVQSV